MHVPIIQVPWCFSVEVDTMGGGSDKGISINERWSVSLSVLALRDYCWCNSAMACELCTAVKWILCQLSVSEQGTMDSCQQQHTPREAKVGRQSWALEWKHTHFSYAPSPLLSVYQTDTRIFLHVQTHTKGYWKWNKNLGRTCKGSLIRPRNVLINREQLHST